VKKRTLATVSEKLAVAVRLDGLVESVTPIVTVPTPAEVGVPVI
jgi:hypothetical protein